MTPGSIVIYVADPLMYGKMLILEVTKDMRLLCEAMHADKNGDFARDLFDSHELELAAKWSEAIA
jgi:hypothetical protein